MKALTISQRGLSIHLVGTKLREYIKFDTILVPTYFLVIISFLLGGLITTNIIGRVQSPSPMPQPTENTILIENDNEASKEDSKADVETEKVEVTATPDKVSHSEFFEYKVNGTWFITQEDPEPMFKRLIQKKLDYEKERRQTIKDSPAYEKIKAEFRNVIREQLLKDVPTEYVDKYCPEIIVSSSVEIQTPKKAKKDDNKAQSFSNLGFILNPTYAKRHKVDPAIVAEKKRIVEAYMSRYVPVAIQEMKLYGIPASITLAQGLLESNAGDSRLAVDANNHFGIKCFSKRCKKGHCKNYTDDTHKDFFQVYDNAWKSYRAHSLFLQRGRYKHLLKLDKTDYKGWAHGLKKAGYATDKRYAYKLIGIIEMMNLQQYDKK